MFWKKKKKWFFGRSSTELSPMNPKWKLFYRVKNKLKNQMKTLCKLGDTSTVKLKLIKLILYWALKYVENWSP